MDSTGIGSGENCCTGSEGSDSSAFITEGVSTVGSISFGVDRGVYQRFLKSKEWLDFRKHIARRDNACDLGCEDHPILESRILRIHHLNPIDIDAFLKDPSVLMDPNNTITTTENTHRAIHYGNIEMLPRDPIVRYSGDTCPWKNIRR